MMSDENKKEFWRWKEYNWRDPDKDWRSAEAITAGVDVGSVSSQAVIMTDGEIYAYSNMRTGSDSPDSARKAMNWALAWIPNGENFRPFNSRATSSSCPGLA